MRIKHCTECLNIENCRLRDRIIDPKIRTCNYAREGCVHYKGDIPCGTDKDMVLEVLQGAAVFLNVQMIAEKTGLPATERHERQIILNAISRLIKEGYWIEKTCIRGIIYYKL